MRFLKECLLFFPVFEYFVLLFPRGWIFTRFIITNNVETIFFLLSIVRATVLTPARARTNL